MLDQRNKFEWESANNLGYSFFFQTKWIGSSWVKFSVETGSISKGIIGSI